MAGSRAASVRGARVQSGDEQNNSNNSNSNTNNRNSNTVQTNRPPNAEVYVDSVSMAKDDNGKPGASTTTFAPSDSKIHCVINLNKAKGGTRSKRFGSPLMLKLHEESGTEDARLHHEFFRKENYRLPDQE